MIEVRNISKSFGKKQVLKDISIVFEQGRVNFIIGKSGSGKSVLTKCTVGLLKADEGDVLYNGKSFLNLSRQEIQKIRQDIGMLFQGSALFDSLTVLQNVMFPLDMFTEMSKAEKEARARETLKRVQLEQSSDLYPASLSGGMMKRVGIARAIVMQPKYLFCDEPNSGLDPQTSILIDNLIKDLTYELNMTTVVISHDLNSVLEIGDNINFLHLGEVQWKGDRKEILGTEVKSLNDFVFASSLMKRLK
ncbi:MAG: ABC transporter ATP-binding protein [Flavobacteriales bacterium]